MSETDVLACLRSPHLAALEELELPGQSAGTHAGVLRAVAKAPVAGRLRRLTVEVADDASAAALGDAVSLVRLRDLTVSIRFAGAARSSERSARGGLATAFVAGWATPRRRAQLERLSLFTYGDLPPAGFAELGRHPWPSLRTLELLDPLLPGDVRALSADGFPHLEELFVVLEPEAADETLEELAKWPAVRGLTRLCFGGGTPRANPDRIVALAESATDLDVLRTFHLEPHTDRTLEPRLRAILGERLWMG